MALSGIFVALPAGSAPESACALNAPDANLAGADCVRAWFDANLRINEIQTVGTEESYKLRPSDSMLSLIKMGSADDAKGSILVNRRLSTNSKWAPAR